MLIFDKGYYGYKNYQLGISKYKIVPFIFPKEKFNRTRLDDILTYPLAVFKKSKKIMREKKIIQQIKKKGIIRKIRFMGEI